MRYNFPIYFYRCLKSCLLPNDNKQSQMDLSLRQRRKNIWIFLSFCSWNVIKMKNRYDVNYAKQGISHLGTN